MFQILGLIVTNSCVVCTLKITFQFIRCNLVGSMPTSILLLQSNYNINKYLEWCILDFIYNAHWWHFVYIVMSFTSIQMFQIPWIQGLIMHPQIPRVMLWACNLWPSTLAFLPTSNHVTWHLSQQFFEVAHPLFWCMIKSQKCVFHIPSLLKKLRL